MIRRQAGQRLTERLEPPLPSAAANCFDRGLSRIWAMHVGSDENRDCHITFPTMKKVMAAVWVVQPFSGEEKEAHNTRPSRGASGMPTNRGKQVRFRPESRLAARRCSVFVVPVGIAFEH